MHLTIDTMFLLKQTGTHRYATYEEPIDKALTLTKLIKSFITKLSNGQIIESEKQNEFDVLREKIIAEAPKFFSNYDWCRHIDGSYQNHFDLNLSNVSNLNGRTLSYHLDNYLKAYRLNQAYLRYSDKQDIIAYSHRRHGFNDFHFKINEEFKGLIKTNFGFGNAAYFKLVLYFNEIPIIPYSAVILYDQANAYSLIDYTRSYPVKEISWKTCLDFTKRIVNEFYDIGQKKFVEKHIVNSLEEFVLLLRSLSEETIFITTPVIHRLNTYLEIPNKNIYFDNPKTPVNFEALNKWIHFSENLSNIDNETDLSDQTIINEYLKQNNQTYNTNDLTFLNRTINYLTRKDLVYEEIKHVIKNISPDYTQMITQKDGFELYHFRSRKAIAALSLNKNLMKLNHYISTEKYVSAINSVAQDIYEKNLLYLQSTENAYLDLQKQYKDTKEEFSRVEHSFQNTEAYKNYKTLCSILKFFKEMGSEDYINSDPDATDDFDETILKERIETYQYVIKGSFNFDFLQVFQETKYKPSDMRKLLNRHSIVQEVEEATLEQVNRLMKLWFTIMNEVDSIASGLISDNNIKAMLRELQNLQHVLALSFNNQFNYFKGFNLFEDIINDYNHKIKEIKEEYNKEKQPVNLINNKYNQVKTEYNKLQTQRKEIKELNSVIIDSIKNFV